MKAGYLILLTLCVFTLRTFAAEARPEETEAARIELDAILKKVDPQATKTFTKTQYRDFLRYMVFGINYETGTESNELNNVVDPSLTGDKIKYHEKVIIERIIDDFIKDEGKTQWELEDVLKDLEEFKLTKYIQEVFSEKVHETYVDDNERIIGDSYKPDIEL
jgi:hypothetical protein